MAARVTLTAHAWQNNEVATAVSSVPANRPNVRTARNNPGGSCTSHPAGASRRPGSGASTNRSAAAPSPRRVCSRGLEPAGEVFICSNGES